MKNYDVKAKRMELGMIKLKDPIKITKVKKMMNLPNPLVMRIIILL
jgi:hypothetical protein